MPHADKKQSSMASNWRRDESIRHRLRAAQGSVDGSARQLAQQDVEGQCAVDTPGVVGPKLALGGAAIVRQLIHTDTSEVAHIVGTLRTNRRGRLARPCSATSRMLDLA